MKINIGGKTFEVSKEEMESNPNEINLNFEGTIRTKKQEETYYNNLKKDLHKAGVEVAIKDYREKYGFEGKNIENLIEAVKLKTLEEAKIEPEEKLKLIQQTVAEKDEALQQAIERLQQKENEYKTFKNQTVLDKELDSYIPKNTILPKEDIKLILKNKLSFDVSENGTVFALDKEGNVIKDKTTADPRDAKDVIATFFQDNQSYLKPIDGGSGQGDSVSGSKKKSLNEFIEEQKQKGISPNSEEFQNNLTPLLKEGSIEMD